MTTDDARRFGSLLKHHLDRRGRTAGPRRAVHAETVAAPQHIDVLSSSGVTIGDHNRVTTHEYAAVGRAGLDLLTLVVEDEVLVSGLFTALTGPDDGRSARVGAAIRESLTGLSADDIVARTMVGGDLDVRSGGFSFESCIAVIGHGNDVDVTIASVAIRGVDVGDVPVAELALRLDERTLAAVLSAVRRSSAEFAERAAVGNRPWIELSGLDQQIEDDLDRLAAEAGLPRGTFVGGRTEPVEGWDNEQLWAIRQWLQKLRADAHSCLKQAYDLGKLGSVPTFVATASPREDRLPMPYEALTKRVDGPDLGGFLP